MPPRFLIPAPSGGTAGPFRKMNTLSLPVRLLRRAVLLALMMFLLSVVVFVFARLAPGDPLQSFYGDSLEQMTDAEKAAARRRLGLDSGLAVQYARWLSNALRGDFGISFKYRQPVLRVIAPLAGNTLLLGLLAYAIVFLLAVPLAVLCTMHEDRFLDRIICQAGTVLHYIPGFWLGVVLVLIFSVNLGWLPSSGAYDIGKSADAGNLILPLTVMISTHLWYYAFMIRNKLLDEVRRDYVLLALSKGASRRRVIWRHCLPNVAPTIVSIMAISIPHVTGGTVIVESVFNYPGIGSLAVESAKYHDYNLLMLVVLITGLAVFSSSLIAQTINEPIDPRMKEAKEIRW